MQHRHALIALALGVLVVPATAVPTLAAASRADGEFGRLYLDGAVVRTLATPDTFPGQGIDPIYAFTPGAAAGQLAVTPVGPGTGGYHGGAWKVYVVTWTAGVTPYLLTSDEAVLAADLAGDVSLTRDPAADFRCPVLP